MRVVGGMDQFDIRIGGANCLVDNTTDGDEDGIAWEKYRSGNGPSLDNFNANAIGCNIADGAALTAGRKMFTVNIANHPNWIVDNVGAFFEICFLRFFPRSGFNA